VDVGVEAKKVAWGEDFTPLGTRIAATKALGKALEQGEAILLEPIVEVNVLSPPEFVGNVVSDLGSRGGELQGIEAQGKSLQRVTSRVALRKMFGYATDLRSLTQGRATFWMKLVHFAPVPEDELQGIIMFR